MKVNQAIKSAVGFKIFWGNKKLSAGEKNDKGYHKDQYWLIKVCDVMVIID